jgi:hypothetical protein
VVMFRRDHYHYWFRANLPRVVASLPWIPAIFQDDPSLFVQWNDVVVFSSCSAPRSERFEIMYLADTVKEDTLLEFTFRDTSWVGFV